MTQEHDTADAARTPGSNVQTPVGPLDIWPEMEDAIGANSDGMNEYLVDVETHTVLLVKATTPETAASKALLHTIEPDDENVTEVARDVHTCVHTGIEDGACDHDEEAD